MPASSRLPLSISTILCNRSCMACCWPPSQSSSLARCCTRLCSRVSCMVESPECMQCCTRPPILQHTLHIQEKYEITIAKSHTAAAARSEEHTSELQSPCNLVCRLLLEK